MTSPGKEQNKSKPRQENYAKHRRGFTKDKTIISKHSISALEETLPASFVRVHRSFIVSLDKIESFSPEFIQLGKYELQVSRSYRHDVEKILKRD